MTNNEFNEAFREHNIRNYRRGTYISRNSLIKCHLLPGHGSEEVSEATYLTINSIFDDMEDEGLMPNTIYGAYAALTAYFEYAVEQGEIGANPVRLARTVRPDRTSC